MYHFIKVFTLFVGIFAKFSGDSFTYFAKKGSEYCDNLAGKYAECQRIHGYPLSDSQIAVGLTGNKNHNYILAVLMLVDILIPDYLNCQPK